jgi:ParB-like chromosome segregation protein Spo0J
MKELSDAPEEQVDLAEISDQPGPYCMSFRFDLDPLMRSIRKFGLIQRPFIIESENGKKDVVIGFRRILALKSLKWDRAPMKVLAGDELSPSDLLLLSLYDNLSSRSFNDVERGMILKRLKPYFSGEEIRRDYMPLLGLPSNESTRILYEKLEELDMALRTSCANGDLSLKTIKALLEMDPEARHALFQWIKDLKLNFNQQTLLVENTLDISLKEETTVLQVLQEKSLLSIKEDQKLNNPQKAKRTLSYLRSRRFPLLTRSEEAFEKRISGLGLPERVKISHAPFFENPDYRLEILFRDGKVLGETVKNLARINELEGICDPWEEGS